jgi:hypothetical protein
VQLPRIGVASEIWPMLKRADEKWVTGARLRVEPGSSSKTWCATWRCGSTPMVGVGAKQRRRAELRVDPRASTLARTERT